MDYVHILVAARLAQADLKTADEALEASPDFPMRLVLMRHLLVAIANVADLEVSVRSLYQKHPALSGTIGPHRKALDFAKYLRNISVGHLNQGVAAKAVEWRPELNKLLREDEPSALALAAFMVLETAINTYVVDEEHRFFESETDLMYPPDLQRFHNFLGQTVHASLRFIERLANVAINEGKLADYDATWHDLALKAGQTDFQFLTKGRR